MLLKHTIFEKFSVIRKFLKKKKSIDIKLFLPNYKYVQKIRNSDKKKLRMYLHAYISINIQQSLRVEIVKDKSKYTYEDM